ncbi:L-arabinose isomerase [Sphingobacterium corticibacter]|uniref:L-arabinose isomerase n=1 Tax=Sphingobacterium corticibacter TaxID=2171749 RepID=A0A2T8HNW3_9SPHI|nr:L-arabinose isomerase [Sphingobacterium corticibacter]PVH27093.1 L-arabinose isomerase [Sphingobacterium corticibacter]
MINLNELEVWFVTGSQSLYGEETLKQAAAHAAEIAKHLDETEQIPVRVVFKPIVKSSEEIYETIAAANYADNCVGIIAWMHTFSPAKMWIRGLKILNKPLLHLHTQYNRDIPWSTIDMDFMNLNQSAHGDREFGHIVSKLGISRKVVTGYWKDEEVIHQINVWSRAASAWNDWQGAKFARFGDNMRFVAVTDGDKVAAESQFGFSVNTYAVGDLVAKIDAVSDAQIDELIAEYESNYHMAADVKKDGANYANVRDAAQIEIGLQQFLEEGDFKGFSNTFEDLHGMKQLPGIATQRLMEAGFGYAGEGDWKTAALVRAAKVMSSGMAGGSAFMEDYTYHLDPNNSMVLGAHMLEVDPVLAADKPSLEVHPLGIGGKEDPARLVFNAKGGDALNASLVDMGDRFRLVVNTVAAKEFENDLPKLPVARVLWEPKPDMKTGCSAWIYAGGAHHTVYSQNLTSEYFHDFAKIANIECVIIDEDTNLKSFEKELLWGELAYKLKK